MNVMPDDVRERRTYVSSDDDERLNIRNGIDAMLRRWRVVAVSVAACLALAALYLVVTPDRFTATAVLMTDTKLSMPSPSQLAQEPLIDPAVVESQIELLKSERIAGKVVDSLKLDADPQFVGGPPDLRTRIAAHVLGRTLPQPTAATMRVLAVDSLLHDVKVTRTGHSYLAEIAATTLDPIRSAQVANAIADAYIQDQLESRLISDRRTVSWMSQRVDEVKLQADAAAAAVDRYRMENSAEIATDDLAVASKLRELAVKADALRSDHDALQNRALRLAQFIQQQSLPTTEARVLTYAEPPLAKSAPKSSVIVLLAGVAGIVVGTGLGLLREALDRKLRRPRQIRSFLGLPFSGILPAAKRPRRLSAGLPLIHLFDARRPWCTATETFRSIKVSVDHSGRRTSGVIVGMVSAWPGEGKSTVTFNLARMLAEVGTRVLAIDADLKKPDLSEALASTSVCGLADLVQDEVPVESCVESTGAGFDLLGSGEGAAPLHPFDVLGSRRMSAALSDAKQRYDYILLDLPALLTSMDSQAVARFVDAFVVVTEYGSTRIDDVERALATSESISNRIIGVVLNKARCGDRAQMRRALRRFRTRRPAILA